MQVDENFGLDAGFGTPLVVRPRRSGKFRLLPVIRSKVGD